MNKTDWDEFNLFCLEHIIIDAFENEKDPILLSTRSIKEKQNLKHLVKEIYSRKHLLEMYVGCVLGKGRFRHVQNIDYQRCQAITTNVYNSSERNNLYLKLE